MSLDLIKAFAIATPQIQDQIEKQTAILPPWKLIDDTELEPIWRVTECCTCYYAERLLT